MRTQVQVQVLVLVLVVAVAWPQPSSASLRPRTPDEFHELLLWAQRVAEGKGKGGNLVAAPAPRGTARDFPRPRPRPPPSPAPPTAAPVWRDDADRHQHLLPSNEEYDRSERFSHSILHGYSVGV